MSERAIEERQSSWSSDIVWVVVYSILVFCSCFCGCTFQRKLRPLDARRQKEGRAMFELGRREFITLLGGAARLAAPRARAAAARTDAAHRGLHRPS